MKAERSRLIPRKHTETLVLLIVVFQLTANFLVSAKLEKSRHSRTSRMRLPEREKF